MMPDLTLVDELQESPTEPGQTEKMLRERVKELNCLYGISRLVERPGISLAEILEGIVNLIPPAWQYPEITGARLCLEGQGFRTPNFQETAWQQAADIKVHGTQVGTIEVCYLEDRPSCDEGPFLKGERDLLAAIAERTGRIVERVRTEIERKQIEEALRESEQRLRAIGDNLPTGQIYQLMVRPDGTSQFTYVSSQVEQLHECTAKEAMADPSLLFDRVVEQDRKGMRLATERSIREMSDYDHVVRIRRKSGEIRWHRMISRPRLAADNVILFDGIDMDITERKQAEEALADYQRQLEAQNAELDAFAQTVAHDLKDPVGLVIGYADLLVESDTSLSQPDRQQAAQTIWRIAVQLDRIIEELLLLAGVRQRTVIREPLAMAEIIEGACARLRLLIRDTKAQIIVLPATDWPAVLGYAPWLEEVWTNYLSNALKYGGQPPQVELGWDRPPAEKDRAESQAAPPQIRFWVRDNGPGLAPEEQAKLFEPFTQLQQVRASGHGLGLSIVRRIVEKLDGQVGVESGPGQGSLFYFTLPAASQYLGDSAIPGSARKEAHTP